MNEVFVSKKELILRRFRFFFEILIVFMGIFLFLLLPVLLTSLLESVPLLYGPLYYSLKAIMIFFAIPVFLYFSNILLESQKRQVKTSRY